MSKQSAGIILYRLKNNILQVLLVHPGGPFWASKDLAAWSIPKGEISENENKIDAAIREFQEETGLRPAGDFIELSPVKLKSGKQIFAWAIKGEFNIDNLVSNTFQLNWPPGTNKIINIPEVDKAGWFTIDEAVLKLNSGQVALVKELELKLKK